jgi:hypothetical protein
MKTLILAAALAVGFLASNAQAAEPAVLKGVTKKQTLTSQQMRSVRGEGLLSLTAFAKVKVDANICAKVVVPCLLNVQANVKVCADVKALAIVRL